MENACFSWSDSAASVVKDVSISVKPGELVVVVGPVASGKSTLVSGVFGFAHLVPPGISKLRGRDGRLGDGTCSLDVQGTEAVGVDQSSS